jgi:flagellar assembly protein FliH
MSRLLRQERAALAASVGSFVVRRGDPSFTPWGSDDGQPRPGNDCAPHPLASDEAGQRFHALGYAEGYEDGRKAAEQEFGTEREAVARLAEALEMLRPEPTNALALLLAETVDRLVREVIGSVDVDPVLLLSRARAAAALIGRDVEPSKLRVHPDDAALLASAELAVEIAPDATLQRGTIILETGHGWIEDGPAVRLERLRAELDRMAAAR